RRVHLSPVLAGVLLSHAVREAGNPDNLVHVPSLLDAWLGASRANDVLRVRVARGRSELQPQLPMDRGSLDQASLRSVDALRSDGCGLVPRGIYLSSHPRAVRCRAHGSSSVGHRRSDAGLPAVTLARRPSLPSWRSGSRATSPLVESDGGDKDRADSDVLPERLRAADDQPV